MPRLPLALVLIPVVLAATSHAAPRPASRVALPTPAAAIARLAKDEAAIRTGRLSLNSRQHREELLASTRGAAGARAAVTASPVDGRQREYLVYADGSWRRDVTTTDAMGNTVAHYLIGVTEKVGRVLQETGHADQAQRNGSVGPEPERNAADQVLFYRAAELLEGVTWKSVKAAGAGLVLTGVRRDETLTVTLRTAPAYAIERLVSSQQVVTPEGAATRGQEITAKYVPGKRDLQSVEWFMYVTGAVNRAILTHTKVEGSQLNLPVPAAELAVAFPAGTKVVDGRVDPPARYVQGDKDPSLAELKALAEARVGGLKVGAAAPGWDLSMLDGKALKLSEYRGRVVLLTFFASWCPPCNAEAPVLEAEIWQKLRDRGVTVIGVNTAERQDPARMAKEFIAKHGVTYPVVLDKDGTAAEDYHVEVLPTTAIIDRKGVLRKILRGFDRDGLLRELQALLAEP